MNQYTSSFVHSFNVSTTHSLYGEKYVDVGGTVMRRNWDRTKVPENWVELWVGCMTSIQPDYVFTASIVTPPIPATRYNLNFLLSPVPYETPVSQQFSMGICCSSGSYYGDGFYGYASASSHVEQYVTRSMGVTVGNLSSGYMYTQSIDGTKIVQVVYTPYLSELNSYSSSTSFGNIIWPVSQPEQNKYSLVYHLLRFKRSPHSYVTTMSMNYITCTSGYESYNWNMGATSSALLAETLKQNSWSELLTKLNTYSSTQYDDSGVTGGASSKWFVDETNGGTFDQFYIAWKGVFSPLMITNVVIRPSGSF